MTLRTQPNRFHSPSHSPQAGRRAIIGHGAENGPVLKTGGRQPRPAGSNPAPSARTSQIPRQNRGSGGAGNRRPTGAGCINAPHRTSGFSRVHSPSHSPREMS